MEFSTSVYFDGFDLNTVDGVVIFNYEANDLPERELKMNKLARADKSILTTAEYASKEIRIIGRICGATKDDSEEKFTELKGYIQQPNKMLKVEQSGTEIEWVSTLSGLSQSRYGDYINFVLIFEASTPIGQDATSSTLLSATGITASSSLQNITVGGSFKAEPIISVTVSALTGGTDADVTITNSQTGQGITVNRTWTAGDVLEIDSAEKSVTINGGDVDYSGLFPTFYPGIRVLGYSDTFSTRTVDISVTYNKQYV